MPLLSLIVILVAIGVIMWLINTYIPMEAKIKTILNITVAVVVVLWLLTTMGLLPDLNAIRVGG